MKETSRLFDHRGLPFGDRLSEESPLPMGVQALIETRMHAGICDVREHNRDDLKELARDHARKWRFVAWLSIIFNMVFTILSIIAWFYAPAQVAKMIRDQVDDKLTEPELKESADRVMASKMIPYVDKRMKLLSDQAQRLQNTLDNTRENIEEKQDFIEQQQAYLSKQLRIRELAVAAKAGSRDSYAAMILLQSDDEQPTNLLNASLKEIELFFDADRNQISFPIVVSSEMMKDPGYSVDELVNTLRTSPNLAEAAVNSLGKLKSKACVKELCDIVLESDNLRVAARATRALQEITEERIRPLEFEKVTKWWEENLTNPIYNGSYDGYCSVVSSMKEQNITNAQLEKFIGKLNSTISSDPDALHSRCLAAGFLLMTTKFMTNKHAQALKLLDEVRNGNASYRWLHVWDAASGCNANNIDKAVEAINRAFQRSPTSDVEETVRKWKIFAPVRENEKINWPSKKDEVAHRDKNANH